MGFSYIPECGFNFVDGIHIDISKFEMTLQNQDFREQFKGNCTCTDCPETCWCLEMHTPKLQLIAKYRSFKNYPHQYESLYYGDVSN